MIRQKPKLVRVQIVDDNGQFVEMKTIRLDQLKIGPKQSDLTEDQKVRVRAIYACRTMMVHCSSAEECIAGFEKDKDPEQEISHWEKSIQIANSLWASGLCKPYSQKQVDDTVILIGGVIDIPSLIGVSDEFVRMVKGLILAFHERTPFAN
jgi:hypothetical protein